MNALTQFKKLPILRLLIVLALVMGAGEANAEQDKAKARQKSISKIKTTEPDAKEAGLKAQKSEHKHGEPAASRDPIPDIVVGGGPGAPPTGHAKARSLRGGRDINSDPIPDVIVGAGGSAGGHVKALKAQKEAKATSSEPKKERKAKDRGEIEPTLKPNKKI